MAYEYITAHDSPNYTPKTSVPRIYGGPRTIDAITIHWWDDPAKRPTFNGVLAWLCRRNGTNSAHEVIEAGRVAVIVNHTDAAWHAGNATGNRTTIGLELNPRCSAGDYQTAAERIADLREFYGDLPLVPHKRWKHTTCPGNYDLDRLDREARAVTVARTRPGPARPSTPSAPTAPTITPPQEDPMSGMTPDQIGAAVADALIPALRGMDVPGGADGPGNLARAVYRNQSELMRVADQVGHLAELTYAIHTGDNNAAETAIAAVRDRAVTRNF